MNILTLIYSNNFYFVYIIVCIKSYNGVKKIRLKKTLLSKARNNTMEYSYVYIYMISKRKCFCTKLFIHVKSLLQILSHKLSNKVHSLSKFIKAYATK